jgi:hypothetical protein
MITVLFAIGLPGQPPQRDVLPGGIDARSPVQGWSAALKMPSCRWEYLLSSIKGIKVRVLRVVSPQSEKGGAAKSIISLIFILEIMSISLSNCKAKKS